ncbi:MAG TPA: hypothetical protein ENH99_01085 [Candidatus Pacearchaeota archaeon]|nr:hypothetical protein [Candidatus Pacearchaeota archaeon]
MVISAIEITTGKITVLFVEKRRDSTIDVEELDIKYLRKHAAASGGRVLYHRIERRDKISWAYGEDFTLVPAGVRPDLEKIANKITEAQ